MAAKPRRLDARVLRVLQRTIRRVRSEPDPVIAARSLARGTTIVGLMLEDIGDRRSLSKYAAWITRAGQAAWGLVELAVPRSLGEILFQHWISLAYAIGAVIAVIGMIAGTPGVFRTGSIMLLAAALVHFVVDLIRQWMLHDRLVKAVAAPLFALSLMGGAWLLYSLDSIDGQIQQASGFSHASRRAGEFVHPRDAVKLGGTLEIHRLMKKSLLIDTGFIVVYTVWFLSAGLLLTWAAASWLPRPYRAFALLLAPVIVTAVSDLIENTQAYLALSGFDSGLELPVSGVKIGSAIVALAILTTLAGWTVAKRR